MKVRELMQSEVLTVRESDSVSEVLDRLTQARLHGAPVLDEAGELSGLISLTDVLFGGMTRADDELLKVGEIMTSPAVTVREDESVRDLCRLMAEIGIHRIPVTRGQEVVGLVSSMDIVAAIARGAAF